MNFLSGAITRHALLQFRNRFNKMIINRGDHISGLNVCFRCCAPRVNPRYQYTIMNAEAKLLCNACIYIRDLNPQQSALDLSILQQIIHYFFY